ncbi:MAG: dihydropteroate synthase [Bacteroidetes bacterium]|nr:dihydropteroate synthase [Bacteroidota bacterium]
MQPPLVMGIINVTPDSFYDGGQFNNEKSILELAARHLSEGAAFLDIGGYSTRQNADQVKEEEELKRVLPALKAIVREYPHATISVDTFTASVAYAALSEGAGLINDASGATNSSLLDVISRHKVPYVLMHTRGNPQTMTGLTDYTDVVADIMSYFLAKVDTLRSQGIADIILDPGFGFAKTPYQNFQLLGSLDQFHVLARPLMVGLSRKSMIWRTLETTPDHALNGTTALHTVALLKGASILRVHDVKQAIECIRLVSTLSAGTEPFLKGFPMADQK